MEGQGNRLGGQVGGVRRKTEDLGGLEGNLSVECI